MGGSRSGVWFAGSPPVHPCRLRLGIPASHGPANQTSLLELQIVTVAHDQPYDVRENVAYCAWVGLPVRDASVSRLREQRATLELLYASFRISEQYGLR